MTYDPRLPWRFEKDSDPSYMTRIIDADNDTITHDETYYPLAPNEDAMKFIVHAVNAYAKMRASLTSIATHDDTRNAKRLAIDTLKSIGDMP